MTWARHPTVPTLSVCSKTLPLRRCKYKYSNKYCTSGLGSSEATPQRASCRQTDRTPTYTYACAACACARPSMAGRAAHVALKFHSATIPYRPAHGCVSAASSCQGGSDSRCKICSSHSDAPGPPKFFGVSKTAHGMLFTKWFGCGKRTGAPRPPAGDG